MSFPTPLKVNDIGEYVRFKSCDRRFYLTVNHAREVKPLPFYFQILNTIDPVLRDVGRKREEVWAQQLQDAGFRDAAEGLQKQKHHAVEWSALVEVLEKLPVGELVYAREVKVQGVLGAFDIMGQIDFLLVRWEGNRPQISLVECKASLKDRTYHRIQVALYRMLLRKLLLDNPLVIAGEAVSPELVECLVARLDEAQNTNQDILSLAALDLKIEEADIDRLLGNDGRLKKTLTLPLVDIPFQLDLKCDGCLFDVHCFAETARLRRVELLGLDAVTTRMLRRANLGTLDQLASPPMLPTREMEALCRDPGFDENLRRLSARARARRATLPNPNPTEIPDDHDVERTQHSGPGQLPAHHLASGRLLRIYLTVDYDYTENRIGALSAHITKSDGRLHTPFNPRPVADVLEQVPEGVDSYGRVSYGRTTRPCLGQDLVEFQRTPWIGNYEADTQAEAELIQRFFSRLVELIAKEAPSGSTPLHFYVWSQSEIPQLLEGCARAGSSLLGHLQQLFGCREGLEQLIYSSLQDEIDRRFALGWTGRGLGVVSSLKWFGRRYHWHRLVDGNPVELDQLFSQNIFDFKAGLHVDAQGNWLADEESPLHTFEIRSRFSDSLPAPYWHAIWGTLPDVTQVEDQLLKQSVEGYRKVNSPALLEAYLTARCQALRWLEENITPKNKEIEKQPIRVEELPNFHLKRDDLARVAIDFLRLDHQIKKSQWLADHLQPPLVRVPTGKTLTLSSVRCHADKRTITGRIALSGFQALSLKDLESRSAFAEGSFARLSPWNGDPVTGQTVKQLTLGIGRTCVVQSIDWITGMVELEGMYAEADGYTLASGGSKQAEVLYGDGFATLDENLTDYVARRVDNQLQNPSPITAWFDHIRPALPELTVIPGAAEIVVLRELLQTFPLPPSGRLPEADQIQAVLDGLTTRVQLLQGPPGTGKTTTTALAVLTRILTAIRPSQIIMLSAHTHRAVDELLSRIGGYLEAFRNHLAKSNRSLLPITLVKVHTGEPTLNRVEGVVQNFAVASMKSQKKLKELLGTGVLVVGGTTTGLLKLVTEFGTPKGYNAGRGIEGSLLVVDEASMMVFPHFLALATLLSESGSLMLTGDHRQLAPIMAHDWENEDRPPAVLYQPHVSAFEAIRRMADLTGQNGNRRLPESAVKRSALRQTFRLPPVVRELIARVYLQDHIELTGPDRLSVAAPATGTSLWHQIWRWSDGIFLVVHDEDGSKRNNPLELAIVNAILQASPELAPNSVAVITPHRAQRSLLTTSLAVPFGPNQGVDTIDTVERLQGGERPTVIVSATVSDPAAIENNVEFIMNLNRANVAFSRVKNRLIVICSRNLLNHIPSEIEHYQSAMLWKALREICTNEVGKVDMQGHQVMLMAPGKL